MDKKHWTLEIQVDYWSLWRQGKSISLPMKWGVYQGPLGVTVTEEQDLDEGLFVCELKSVPRPVFEEMEKFFGFMQNDAIRDKPEFDCILNFYSGNKKTKKYKIEKCESVYDDKTKTLCLSYERLKGRKIKKKSGLGHPVPDTGKVYNRDSPGYKRPRSEWEHLANEE